MYSQPQHSVTKLCHILYYFFCYKCLNLLYKNIVVLLSENSRIMEIPFLYNAFIIFSSKRI